MGLQPDGLIQIEYLERSKHVKMTTALFFAIVKVQSMGKFPALLGEILREELRVMDNRRYRYFDQPRQLIFIVRCC